MSDHHTRRDLLLHYLKQGTTAPFDFVPSAEPDLVGLLRAEGYHVATVGRPDLQTPHHLFQSLQREFRLPRYFGHNWDALDECMLDLDWLSTRSFVLLVEDIQSVGLTSRSDA